jgi:hypothetical protein
MESEQGVDGLVFNYCHFFGDTTVYKHTRNIYRREVRLIRNGKGIKSWKDAQGFRAANESKILAKRVNATIYHYGWARAEKIMSAKVNSFSKLYHQDSELESRPDFIYEKGWGMREFKGTHPAIMEMWIEKNRNNIDFASMKMRWQSNFIGLFISDIIEASTGYRIGEYKNYKLIGEI